jgi:hypothetical protein
LFVVVTVTSFVMSVYSSVQIKKQNKKKNIYIYIQALGVFFMNFLLKVCTKICRENVWLNSGKNNDGFK